MKKLRIGIVVGEVSGDTLGANLIKSFQAQGIEVEFEGIGGTQMTALGFNSLYPMEKLAVMGIVEVLKELRGLFAVRDGLLQHWQKNPIDIFIGIDAPDFNLRLSKKIKHEMPTVKTVQYVSPSVWAWRQKRVFGIKKSIDLVMCLFPFECDFYHKYAVPAVFVGHPLAQQLPLQENQSVARQQLQLDEQHYYIALLPGSRKGEVERLFPILLETVQQLQQRHHQLKFLVPAINTARYQQIQYLLENAPNAVKQAIQVIPNTTSEANIGRVVMEASDCIALASGTATLEAMLLHKPMVAFYRLHWLSYWLMKRLIKIQHYSLPNIIAGQAYVRELIQQQATASHLTQEIERLMIPEVAAQQRLQHQHLHQQLQAENNTNPVQAILQLI